MSTRTDDEVVTIILHQHEEAKRLLEALGSAPIKGRQEPFRALVSFLTAHETTEQQVVYPALRELGADGARIADERIAEEEAATAAIAKMQSLDPASLDFAQAYLSFRADVEAHAAKEEAQVLPLLAKVSDEDSHRMAEAFRAAEQKAAGRPLN